MSPRLVNKVHPLIFLSFCFLLIGPILLSLFLLIPSYLNGKISPQTNLAGINLSYQPKKMAEEIISSRLAVFLKTPFVLIFKGKTTVTSAAELGFSVNKEKLFSQLPVMDQNNLGDLVRNFFWPKTIHVKPDFAQSVADKLFHEKYPEISQAREAKLIFSAERQLKIEPEKTGTMIDYGILQKDMTDSLNRLEAKTIAMAPIIIKPELTTADLELIKEKILKKLDSSFRLRYLDTVFTIKLADHINWLSFKKTRAWFWPDLNLWLPVALKEETGALPLPISTKLSLALQTNEVLSFIESTVSPKITVKPQDISIYHNEKGGVVFDGNAVNGRTIDKSLLLPMMELAINNDISLVNIPVKETKAAVLADDELKNLGIKELMGVGYTDFSGSPPNRIHNIGVALKRLNGQILAPGQTYSFLKSIGEISAKTGYKKELVIKEGETIPDFGGGICQVSSTLYRAVLYSGLPVTQRVAHTYAVNYYFRPSGPGLDATIFSPSPDLKFANDTPAHILIQAYAYGTAAYFKFYGTSDGREVIMDGPYRANEKKAPKEPEIKYTTELPPGQKKQVDKAHDGFEVTWYRTVIKGSEAKNEKIFSRYKAWPDRFLVGVEKGKEEPIKDQKVTIKN